MIQRDLTPLHSVAVRIWSNPVRIDEAATPSGKKFHLISIPFYYISQLEGIVGDVVNG